MKNTTNSNPYTEDEEQYFRDLMNSVDDSIRPSNPWDLDEFRDIFIQINQLLPNSPLDENLRQQVAEIIRLSQAIEHLERINPDFLGLYTTNLMRMLDPNDRTDNGTVEEVIEFIATTFENIIATENSGGSYYPVAHAEAPVATFYGLDVSSPYLNG